MRSRCLVISFALLSVLPPECRALVMNPMALHSRSSNYHLSGRTMQQGLQLNEHNHNSNTKIYVAAIAAVEAAKGFGEPTARAVSKWAKDVVKQHAEGKTRDRGMLEFTLIEECLLDSPECDALEEAIKELQLLCGGWVGVNT